MTLDPPRTILEAIQRHYADLKAHGLVEDNNLFADLKVYTSIRPYSPAKAHGPLSSYRLDTGETKRQYRRRRWRPGYRTRIDILASPEMLDRLRTLAQFITAAEERNVGLD